MRAVNMRVLDVVEKIYNTVMPMLNGGEMLFHKICSRTWVEGSKWYGRMRGCVKRGRVEEQFDITKREQRESRLGERY